MRYSYVFQVYHSPLLLLFCCYTVMLTLKAVGIPSEVLPVTDESKLLVDDHLKWLARLNMIEEAEALEPPSKRSRAERELKIETFDPESISNLCKNSLSCYTVG